MRVGARARARVREGKVGRPRRGAVAPGLALTLGLLTFALTLGQTRTLALNRTLLGHFMTIMPYFSMKWSASSPTACPQMIILVPGQGQGVGFRVRVRVRARVRARARVGVRVRVRVRVVRVGVRVRVRVVRVGVRSGLGLGLGVGVEFGACVGDRLDDCLERLLL